MQGLHTFDNCLHISNKAMDDTQRLGNSHPGLVLCQSIQPLENCLNLALPEQLFGEFLCGTYIEPRTMYV